MHTVACQTDSVKPASELSFVWRRNNGVVEETSRDVTGADYNGENVTSSYSFIPDRTSNEDVISCTPVWNNNEMTSLQQNIALEVHCKLSSTDEIIN